MTDDQPGFGRTDDVDHDLLTFGEAGARLRANIADARQRITQLETGNDDPTEVTQALRQARERLRDLEDGAVRNTTQRINDGNFQEFFGYPRHIAM
jgi:hypothetical protein